MSAFSEPTPRLSAITDIDGGWRSKIDASWRIAAVAASVGLLLCGSFAFALRSRSASSRSSAVAVHDHGDIVAAERIVAAFWREREVLGEYRASPLPILAAEVLVKQRDFATSLRQIHVQSPAELSYVDRARAANAAMVEVFDKRVSPSEQGLHVAELKVVAPVSQLTAINRRQYKAAETAAASADGAGLRAALAATLLGLVAIAWFAIFAFRLVRRINNQNVELQLADVAKDEFINTVSHELRTPLTSMHGFVELLLDETGEPLTKREQRIMLATVQRGSARLTTLVNDLLLTAQLRAGRLDMQMTIIDIVAIARQSVENVQAQAHQKTLQVSLSAPPHTIEIEADALRLSQALDNVISNAIKFTPADGHIEVALTHDTEHATVTVTDSGMGMTAADIKRLFEPFFRTGSAMAKQIQGTGLGLPIVKAIIEAHDGTINITSEPNVGTSFAISLALAQPLGTRTVASLGDLVVAA